MSRPLFTIILSHVTAHYLLNFVNCSCSSFPLLTTLYNIVSYALHYSRFVAELIMFVIHCHQL